MLNVVLLGGKVLFLVILYLFVLFVIRAALKDVGLTGRPPSRAGMDAWSAGEVKSEWRPLPREIDEIPTPGVTTGVRGWERHREEDGRSGWTLLALQGPVRGRLYRVPPDARLVIGRSLDTNIHLADTFVSAHHARLQEGTEGLVLQDLASTNGTYVNGKAVSRPVRLQHGDEVGIGNTVFRVEVV